MIFGRTPGSRAAALVGAIAGLAALGACMPAPVVSGSAPHSLTIGGVARTYLLYQPPAATNGVTRLPLLLAFHGGGGTAADMETLTGLGAVAERESFFLVYPQGVNDNWNDGRPGINDGVDDVGFIRALLDELTATLPVDSARVFATGISNGGHFCHRLAFELRDRIAAIAPVAAALSTTLAARPAPRATPILMIVGDADPIAPYTGGRIGVGPVNRGAMLSVADAARLWVSANSAAEPPLITFDPDSAQSDGARVRRENFAAGPAPGSAPVVVLTIEGGGHTWPGGPQYLPEFVIGRTCRDISASSEIWTFFEALPQP